MKRLVSVFLSLLTLAFSLAPALKASAAATNLIPNPSVETGTGTAPTGFLTGNWGTNTTAFSWATTGHTGSRSAKVQITKYTDGDAKWYFTPINATAGAKYTYSDWYTSNIASDVVVQFDNGTTDSYTDLGTVPAASAWTQFTGNFTVPAGMKHVTVFHLISAVGSLQTDDYSLTQQQASNLAVNVTTPVSTVSGTSVALSATATSTTGVAGVQFKVDGVNVGSEDTTSPYSIAWNSTSVANGVHSITATGRDTDGTLVTSAPVQLTVNNTTTGGGGTTGTTTNMVPNPGLETVDPANSAAPSNWANSSWGTNTTAFTYVTNKTNVHGGKYSVKTQMTSYTDGDAKWYFTPQAVDATKLYNFSDWYKSTTESYVVVDFGMADGTDQYVTLGTLAKESAWTQYQNQFSVPLNAKTVTVFHMIQSVGTVFTDDYSLAPYTPVGFDKARVSITFDDAWASVYNNALPVLDKYGFKSTQYLLTGNTADPEYMTAAMMKAMGADGQEVASHTVDHQDLVTLTAAQQKTELNNSKTSLQSWTGKTVTDFAAPYGSYDQTVTANIQKYYSSQRGVVAGFNSKNYFNIYDIKVQDVETNTTLAQIQSWIAQAQATNTWLVLVYHQVTTDPAAGDYNTTPTDLDTQFNAIKSSGIAVETVAQALAELKPQL